jgi:zinc and cadmium transporter
MTESGWLVGYSALVLMSSLLGGGLPFLGRVTHGRLQLYLSLSAGVMLGAAVFHIMPEAVTIAGPYFGWWMALGIVGLFAIERFIAPHSHELDDGKHAHSHPHSHNAHETEPGHEHSSGHGEHRAAAPAVAGWMAVLGLTLHTFMNGVGLAGAVHVEFKPDSTDATGLALRMLPGLAMFLAIVLHKPADALAISMVLSRKGVGRRAITLVQLGFALMVPVGAAVFAFTEGRIAEGLEDQLTGAALAFSAGTFLFIALSDLLPEVQFHRHDRIPLFLALTAGVVLMGCIGLLEGHGEGEHDHGHTHHHDH